MFYLHFVCLLLDVAADGGESTDNEYPPIPDYCLGSVMSAGLPDYSQRDRYQTVSSPEEEEKHPQPPSDYQVNSPEQYVPVMAPEDEDDEDL